MAVSISGSLRLAALVVSTGLAGCGELPSGKVGDAVAVSGGGAADQPTTPAAAPKPFGAEKFKLSGFAGRKDDPLVMLNTGRGFYTFGVNESQSVQTPAGLLKIRCVAIVGKAARFSLGNEGYELELRVY